MKLESLLDAGSYPTPAGVIPEGEPGYRRCTRCVMDTTDPNIVFDETGECNHCKAYDVKVRTILGTAAERAEKFARSLEAMRADGKGKDYDCVIGVSGGVDSTYVAYLVREHGLRPLAVHMDNGWNSELAVSNIQKTLDTLGIDLFTEVLDWDEFRDLQLAFLKASTPDSEIPTDHAITAVLLDVARKNKIRHIIGGSNIRTEGIMPNAWSQGIRDWKYIKSVHDRFGTVPLRTFPHFTLLDFVMVATLRGVQWVNILNQIEYSKQEAMRVLEDELGWKYYGGKHYESVYTRFFQGFILPVKFKADKRKAHLSTLICSGEITREQALEELKTLPYDPATIEADIQFVAKKFGISVAEFEEIMRRPLKTIRDYPAYENMRIHEWMRGVYRLPRRLRKKDSA